MMLVAAQNVQISDGARHLAKLTLESARNELGGCSWDQENWLVFQSGAMESLPSIMIGDYELTVVDSVCRLVAARHVAQEQCGARACIAGHAVIAALLYETHTLERYEDHAEIADIAMDLLELIHMIEYPVDDQIWPGPVVTMNDPDTDPWLFDAGTSPKAIEAMFHHASDYGEWPLLSEAQVLQQLGT